MSFRFSPPLIVHGIGYDVEVTPTAVEYTDDQRHATAGLESGAAPLVLGGLTGDAHEQSALLKSRILAALRAIGFEVAVDPGSVDSAELITQLAVLATPSLLEVLEMIDRRVDQRPVGLETGEFVARIDGGHGRVQFKAMMDLGRGQLELAAEPAHLIRALVTTILDPEVGGRCGFVAEDEDVGSLGDLSFREIRGRMDRTAVLVEGRAAPANAVVLLTVDDEGAVLVARSARAVALRTVGTSAAVPLLARVLWGDGTRNLKGMSLRVETALGAVTLSDANDAVVGLEWLTDQLETLADT